jgi:hypothetical protein
MLNMEPYSLVGCELIMWKIADDTMIHHNKEKAVNTKLSDIY